MRLWTICLVGSLATGLCLAALFPPLGWTALAPVALAPLLFALAHEPRAGRRFLWGWLCGCVDWLLVCHWIRGVVAAYGGLSGPLSWLAVLLFAMAKGLHLASFAALAGFVLRRRWAIPATAALWTGIERTHGPLGFTWLALGNAGIGMPVPLRLAPWVGVYGVSFVLAAVAAAVAVVAVRRSRKELAWLLPLPLLFLLPAVEARLPPDREAVAVQPDFAATTEWSGQSLREAARRLSMRSLSASLDIARPAPALLLWPEAPVPFYYYDDPAFRGGVSEIARLAGIPFLFGGVAYNASRQPLNSAILLDSAGRLAGRYDKTRLVPFGEFVPPGFQWITKISSEAGDFASGQGAFPLHSAGHPLGVFICYESAFPDYVRQFAANGAEVLVNLTNDGYFGHGPARGQHLLLARMRAVENRLWLLRASNNGVTASIDPAGQVRRQLPEYSLETGRLPFRYIRERSFYSRHGDWFAWLALLGGLAGVLATQVPSYRRLE